MPTQFLKRNMRKIKWTKKISMKMVYLPLEPEELVLSIEFVLLEDFVLQEFCPGPPFFTGIISQFSL